MALRIVSLLLTISSALIAGQNFIVGSSDSGACIGSYCCDGSLIGGTGNSNDASDFTCCLGDPNHGIINGVPDMTCSAGSAVPLTAAATGSVATTSTTTTSAASSSASPTSESSSDDDSDDSSDDSSTSTADETSATAATASGSMISSTTSQRSNALSSNTPTSSISNSASASSESASAGATDNAAVGGHQFSAGQIVVGILALGYNIVL
jgi:hypothetical protein